MCKYILPLIAIIIVLSILLFMNLKKPHENFYAASSQGAFDQLYAKDQQDMYLLARPFSSSFYKTKNNMNQKNVNNEILANPDLSDDMYLLNTGVKMNESSCNCGM